MPIIKILPHAEYCPQGAEITASAGTSICEALLENKINIRYMLEDLGDSLVSGATRGGEIMNYTPKQLRILKMIYDYQQEHGFSPTYAELAGSFARRSSSWVTRVRISAAAFLLNVVATIREGSNGCPRPRARPRDTRSRTRRWRTTPTRACVLPVPALAARTRFLGSL